MTRMVHHSPADASRSSTDRRHRNHEIARLRPRPVSIAVALALLSLEGSGLALAQTLPTGANVAAGAATFQQPNAHTMVVNQSSERAVILYNSFSIGASNSVVFRQPGASSVALNRVVGQDPSLIYGSLQANGQVFLVNPSGILFGRGASVNVGSLVASTLGISNQDFLAGRYLFAGGSGAGTVVNEATIRAADGGYVALLGKQVSNTGTLVANRGSVGLGAGESMLLDFNGDGLLSVKVNAAAAAARIDHTGVIQADGGQVSMSARAKNALLGTVLNVEGIVMARGLSERNGAIYLDGGGSGVTSVSGTLDVGTAVTGQRGGEIRALGEYVGLFDNATLSASGPAGGGTILIGGDFQGANPAVSNAKGVFVGSATRIAADAAETGDGGKVILWSDEATRFHGQVSARGGPSGGDGGFVEISGKASLAFRGRVDATAPKGKVGTLLLDPDTVTLKGGVGDGDANESNFTFNGSGIAGTVQFADTFGTTLFESEIEEQSKTAAINIQARRSLLIDNVEFNYNSGNPGDAASGVVALAANSTLTLQTRNNGAAETGVIDLVTGGFHGANLRIVTSGTGGRMTVQSGVQGNQPTNIRLPQLSAGAGGISVSALAGGNIDIASASLGSGTAATRSVEVRSLGAGAGAVTITGLIDTRGAAASDGSQHGDNVIIEGNTISVSAINASGGAGVGSAVGGFGATVSLTAPTTTLNGNITATGGNGAAGAPGGGGLVDVRGATRLGSNVAIDTREGTNAAGARGNSGSVSFFGPVDADVAANNRTLTVNAGIGQVLFTDHIGNTAALADLDVTAGLIQFGFLGTGTQIANVTAQGGNTITFNGPVTLDTDVILNAGSNSLTFSQTLNPASPETTASAVNLTVNSAGQTTFAGPVGNNDPLVSLTTDAPGTTAFNGGSVTTLGTQTYNDPVVLGADTTLTSIQDANITFGSTVESPGTPRSLTVSTGGTTTFGGPVGGNGNPLLSLTSGTFDFGSFTTVINGGSVTTVANQTYLDAVQLGGDTILTSSTGDISFASTINADAAGNNRKLTINAASGTTTFNGDIGNTQPLADLDVTANSILFSTFGNVPQFMDVSAQGGNTATFSGPVTLSNDLTITAGANSVTFGGSVDSVALSSERSLVVNSTGVTTFGDGVGDDRVGGAVALLSLTTDAGGTTVSNIAPPANLFFGGNTTASIRTLGNQTYNDPFTLNQDTFLLSTQGTVTFNAGLNTNGRALFVSPVSGGCDGVAGSSSVAGGATFNNCVTLFGDFSLTSTGGGNIAFNQPVNSLTGAPERSLTVSTATGNVVLGPVGNTAELASLGVTANQLTLNGAVRVNGGGAVDFRNVSAIVFATGVSIDTDRTGAATNAGAILMGPATTMNSPGPSAANLTLDATADGSGTAGAVDLGTIGNLVPVALLTVSGNLVSVNGNVTASQIGITADEVRTDPTNGVLTATLPLGQTAALTLRGLTTDGIFGRAGPPDTNALRVDVPGLLVVLPNVNRSSPVVWLRGVPGRKPVYEFADSNTNRIVCYNNDCGNPPITIEEIRRILELPQERAALASVLDQLRKLLDEILMAGFSKENVRKQLVQGIVLETGRARPGIDEFVGDGVRPPASCTPNGADAASGNLVCP